MGWRDIGTRTVRNPLLSVRVFLGVLAFLSLACATASVVPQGEAPEFYLRRYGPVLGPVVLRSGLTEAYRSWWFLAAEAWLALSTGACTWRRFKALFRGGASPGLRTSGAGLFLAHLGFLMVLTTLAVRPFAHQEDYFTVAEGSAAGLRERGHPFEIYVREFRIERYPDGAPKQYLTRVEVREDRAPPQEATIAVNHPLNYRGIKIYQFDWGWMVRGTVRDGDAARSFAVPSGGAVNLGDGSALRLFARAAETNPAPGAFYLLYLEGRVLTAGPVLAGRTVPLPGGSLTLEAVEPYSGLRVKREPTLPLTLAGFFLACLGLGVHYTARLARRDRRS